MFSNKPTTPHNDRVNWTKHISRSSKILLYVVFVWVVETIKVQIICWAFHTVSAERFSMLTLYMLWHIDNSNSSNVAGLQQYDLNATSKRKSVQRKRTNTSNWEIENKKNQANPIVTSILFDRIETLFDPLVFNSGQFYRLFQVFKAGIFRWIVTFL